MNAARTLSAWTAALILGAAAFASPVWAAPDEDMSLGDPAARVVLIEYMAPTSPHSATWQADVFPVFKRKYIDTGQVRFVLREAPIHGAPDVAGFLLARCAGGDKYFDVLSELMRDQSDMGMSMEYIRDVLLKAARANGIDEAGFVSCISDTKAQDALTRRSEREMKELDIDGTPTFVLNGRKIAETGEDASLDKLSAQIDSLLAARKN
jgi:protein-disulfide isomerase